MPTKEDEPVIRIKFTSCESLEEFLDNATKIFFGIDDKNESNQNI